MSAIQLTDAAALEVKRMLEKEGVTADKGLRISVKDGGCSGYSYEMNFDTKKSGDMDYEYHGLHVFVDPRSYLYLNGMTLDYADTLQDKGFRFRNPNADKTCSCGESFAVKKGEPGAVKKCG